MMRGKGGALAAAAIVVALSMACGASHSFATEDAAGVVAAEVEDPLFSDLDAELDARPDGFPDPLEEINRRTLIFNRFVDRWILDPVTRLYSKFLPAGIKTSIRSAFVNLASVPGLANHILQLDAEGTAVTAGRLVVNSTIGLLGLLDPATEMGLDDRHADFGQTLAKLGVGSGPYFIIPLLGPTTVRDGGGGMVDMLIHPATFFFGPFQRLTYSSGSGLSLRESNYEALKALDESSIDYYAALRNAYYQARIAEIWNGAGPPPRRTRVCASMAPRLRRQPWRVPDQCAAAAEESDSSLATCRVRF
jgi:phospholipid-binding lipoprotein MlaA